MFAIIHFPIPTSSLCIHAPQRTQFFIRPPPMTLSKLSPLRHHLRRRFGVSAAAVRQDTTLWTPAPLVKISPAAESLFNITIDISDSPELASSYTKAGQYLQLRLQDPESRPSFLAIASPPSFAWSKGVFEFLVKSVAGSTAELLCGLQKGDVVELSAAMGKGFNIDEISPAENYQTVLIFATGSGIRLTMSPQRKILQCDEMKLRVLLNTPLTGEDAYIHGSTCSLESRVAVSEHISSGFGADKRADVRLYYGARNLNRMAYQERFKEWKSTGVDIVQVLSQPDDGWMGGRGYVQAAFATEKGLLSPQSTGAVLCGQKQMAEEVTSILVADGVSGEKILKNF